MDRRNFMLAAGAAGAAVASLPTPARTAPPLENLCLEVALPSETATVLYMKPPPSMNLLRQLYLAPGSFTTPHSHGPALILERLGFLERSFEDRNGVYWTLTAEGRETGAALIAKNPDGVLPVRMPELSAA